MSLDPASADARRFGRVAVLLGGSSAERPISLKSGAAVLAALRAAGVDAVAVDPAEEGLAEMAAGRFARVFVVLHGRGGEDGTVQGALDSLGIPYTGSGVLGSSLAMDKWRSKLIWRALGLPTPVAMLPGDLTELMQALDALRFPLAVKPVHEGSSLGLTKVERAGDLPAAWQAARAMDDRVMVEEWIEGGEYTAAVLGGEVLPLIRVETPREFYDFEAKYNADSTQYHCPCGLPTDLEARLADQALRAFEAVGAGGWGRVDFMLDEQQRPWFMEVNTVPGMTDHSLVPMAARQAGMDFQTLVLRILAGTLDDV